MLRQWYRSTASSVNLPLVLVRLLHSLQIAHTTNLCRQSCASLLIAIASRSATP